MVGKILKKCEILLRIPRYFGKIAKRRWRIPVNAKRFAFQQTNAVIKPWRRH